MAVTTRRQAAPPAVPVGRLSATGSPQPAQLKVLLEMLPEMSSCCRALREAPGLLERWGASVSLLVMVLSPWLSCTSQWSTASTTLGSLACTKKALRTAGVAAWALTTTSRVKGWWAMLRYLSRRFWAPRVGLPRLATSTSLVTMAVPRELSGLPCCLRAALSTTTPGKARSAAV